MNQIETPPSISLIEFALFTFLLLFLSRTQHSMIYFFHHYELPSIVQQAQLQQIFMRSVRNNNNGQATATPPAGGNQQNQNRENQQQQAGNEAPPAAAAPERPAANANNMFVIRGVYRHRVNNLVGRLRNTFYSNVFGFGMMADNNNNNAAAAANNPGLNNLTRSLRLLNLLFPNRPILNVRIINVRSASASATVADILRTAEGGGGINQVVGEESQEGQENLGVGRESADAGQESPPSDNENQQQSTVDHNPTEFPAAVRLQHQENPENSLTPLSVTSDNHPLPPDPSFGSNNVNVVPESTMKHRGDGDVNNSENVMQSTTTNDGGTTTSSSNEQC